MLRVCGCEEHERNRREVPAVLKGWQTSIPCLSKLKLRQRLN